MKREVFVLIIDERLSTYIDSISWSIPEYLKEVEKEALADGVPIIRRLRNMQLKSVCSLLKKEEIEAVGIIFFSLLIWYLIQRKLFFGNLLSRNVSFIIDG